jgi:hypothetical protein
MHRVRVEPGTPVGIERIAPASARDAGSKPQSGLPDPFVESLGVLLADVLEAVFVGSYTDEHVQALAHAALRQAGGALESIVLAHPDVARRLAHWAEAGARVVSDSSLVPGGVIARAGDVEIDARAQVQLLRAVQQRLEERCR